MKNISLLILIFIALACNQQTGNDQVVVDIPGDTRMKKGNPDNDEQVDPTTGGLDGCYWKILDRDTLVVTLKQVGQDVSGKMTFDNYQKDGSTGTVKGKIEGSVIKLWYTFQSEGMQSIMEVYLQQQGNKLVRGDGDMEVKGDSTVYKNPGSVTFTNQLVYDKVDCEKIPAKYK